MIEIVKKLPRTLAPRLVVTIGTAAHDESISPKGNPKPFMQWERNNFAEASNIFSIEYFQGSKL